MRTKKALALIAAGIAAILVLSGCTTGPMPTTGGGPTDAPKEDIQIAFMGWGHPNEKLVFDAMIKKYEEKFTNVKVLYQIASPAEYDTKLNTMIAAKTEPDLFFFKPENLMAWADAGKIADLTGFIEKTTLFQESNVWKQAIDRYRYDGENVGTGSIWALPKDVGPWSMVINLDLFEKCGVTPPTPDKAWTWDELIANAKKMTYDDNGRKIYGLGYFMLECAVWSNGADFIDSTHRKVTVDTPEFVEAMQWVADLRLKQGIMPSNQEEASLGSYVRFINGGAAIFAMGPWDQAAFWKLPFKWDIMPWPTSPRTGLTRTFLGSAGFAVSAESAHPQEAFDLAAFFSLDPDGQKINYEMGQAVPNLIDMAETGYKSMDKAPASKQVFFDIIDKFGVRPSSEFTYNGEWLAEFWTNSNKVWDGSLTAAEYCKDVQPRMQVLLDKSWQMKEEAKK